MKKSFAANINGRIYNIDDDAFARLNSYFDQLRAIFPGEEGREIVADIEARVSELLDEDSDPDSRVVTLSEVDKVISILGRPADLRSEISPDEGAPNLPPPPFPETPLPHKLYRDLNDKVLGGVLSGIGIYSGISVTLLRAIVLILALFTTFWPVFLAYTAAWLIIPPANTPLKCMELRGKPLNMSTIADNVRDISEKSTSVFTTILNLLAKGLMLILGVVGGCLCIVLSIGFISCIVCCIALPFTTGELIFFEEHISPNFSTIGAFITAAMVMGFLLIPCIALVWASLTSLLNIKGASRKVIISALIIEGVLLLGAVIGGVLSNLTFLP